MKRGEVYWADLVPRSGSERAGRRPVILVSHDGFNQTPGWRSIIVVPMPTSLFQGKRGPTVVNFRAGRQLGEDELCRTSSGAYAGSRQADQVARHTAVSVNA
jgi:mRNA-degrading endonuclease toxin of MazEF toxin-antitoxin module